MSRKIYCTKCGVLKPMHPADAAQFKRRREHIRVDHDLQCDGCNQDIPAKTLAVAETWWNPDREGPPGCWETDFGTIL